MNDSDLIGRILAGDDRLFGELVGRYERCVWAICSSYIPNASDCEDVAQQALLQCYLQLNTLRDRAAFGRWLTQIVRRTCLDWLRAAGKRRSALERYGEHLEHTQEREEMTERVMKADLRRAVLDLVQTLPPKSREAMFLCYAEGCSVTEAASLLGVSADAVSKRISYGRKLVLERIGAELEPALAERRHREEFSRAAMAAIPFGTAPWLSGVGAGAGVAGGVTAKLGTLGVVAAMSKKMIGGIGLALLVIAGLTYTLVYRTPQVRPADQQQKTETSRGVSKRATPEVTEAQEAIPSAPKEVAAIPRETRPANAPIVVAPAPKPANVASASVSGWVRDIAGGPIGGASIRLEVTADESGYGVNVAKAFETTSGSDGRYEIDEIKSFGEARAYACAAGYVMQRNHARLAAGASCDDVDFSLKEALYFVAGRVVSQQGNPISGAIVGTPYYGYGENVDQSTISYTNLVFAVTDERGQFEVAIPCEGLCDFTVRAEGYGPGYFPRVHTGTLDAKFVLQAGAAIAGVVRDKEGKPAAGVIVEAVGTAPPGGWLADKMPVPAGLSNIAQKALDAVSMQGQQIPTESVFATTDSNGAYKAEDLGDRYVYTVTAAATRADESSQLPEEDGVRCIARALFELERDVRGLKALSAKKEGIRVEAGQVKSGVDLVLGSIGSAFVQGTVKDRTTGLPVCPVTVVVAVNDTRSSTLSASQKLMATLGGTGVTNRDGSYRIEIANLSEKHMFAVSYYFMTEGGSSWPHVEEIVASVELEPDSEEQVDFSVDAPITVPVRYVDGQGAPIEGVLAAMREAGGGGGCGGSLKSDADGRAVFHGVLAGISLQALAWKDKADGVVTIGVSEPFMGQPGETVPEVVVPCHQTGGFEGALVDSAGSPAANTRVMWHAVAANGSLSVSGRVETDAGGAFTLPGSLAEGVYSRVVLSFAAKGQTEVALVEGVEILPDQMTELGTTTATAYSQEEAMNLLHGG